MENQKLKNVKRNVKRERKNRFFVLFDAINILVAVILGIFGYLILTSVISGLAAGVTDNLFFLIGITFLATLVIKTIRMLNGDQKMNPN